MGRVLQKILYVEDEPDIQTITSMALETFGNFTLKICNNGKEALECIESFEPDLVLSDVMMPEMDGPTLLQNLKNNPKFQNIPVIFTTAKAQLHEIEHYKELGAANVLSKPFNLTTLSSELQELWNSYGD